MSAKTTINIDTIMAAIIHGSTHVTVNAVTGALCTTGYAVGIYPSGYRRDTVQSCPNASWIEGFINRNRLALSGCASHYLRVWSDPDTCCWHLDIVSVRDSRNAALKWAYANDQKVIWDLESGLQIGVGRNAPDHLIGEEPTGGQYTIDGARDRSIKRLDAQREEMTVLWSADDARDRAISRLDAQREEMTALWQKSARKVIELMAEDNRKMECMIKSHMSGRPIAYVDLYPEAVPSGAGLPLPGCQL